MNNIKLSAIMSLLLIITVAFTGGCKRGTPTSKSPIHLNPNMDYQPKYEAQETSDFFDNGASNRLQVEGTVGRGRLNEDIPFYTGKETVDGEFISEIPIALSEQDERRGEDRYRIYCAMCHGMSGSGNGIVIEKGFFPPPKYSDDKLLKMSSGQIFHTITNGYNNMQSYKQQIPVRDRWLIVDHVRKLQVSVEDTGSGK